MKKQRAGDSGLEVLIGSCRRRCKLQRSACQLLAGGTFTFTHLDACTSPSKRTFTFPKNNGDLDFFRLRGIFGSGTTGMPKHSGSRGNFYQFSPYDRSSMYRGRGGSTQPRGGGRGRGNYASGSFRQQNKPHQGGITLVDSMSLRSIRQDSQPDPPSLKVVSNSKGGGRQDNIIAKVPGLQTTYAANIDNQQSLLDIYKMMPRGKLSIIIAVTPVAGNNVTTTELDWSILQGHPQSPPSATNEENGVGDDEEQMIDDTSTVVADENEATVEPTYDAQGLSTTPDPGSRKGASDIEYCKEFMTRKIIESGSRRKRPTVDNATAEPAHIWSPESTETLEPTDEVVPRERISPKVYSDLVDLSF
ncbi:hypothetical protein NW762_008877 [Fusarium torreyae]|uniref:Uncharacterized protein n=1 Tax=Fusarium torreyae TaxID=1237075 RepID=A0A9W8RXW7_9HYPO|nr:hypothetical protein NW762_008877 [Fusarium torreyae]